MSQLPANDDAEVLSELAQLGLALARELQGRVMAADDAVAAELSLAFHRVSRSVRQTLALKAKLARDVQADAGHRAQARAKALKARVRLTLERAIWNEAEADEAEQLVDDLDDILDVDALAEDFTATSPEAHVARIRAQMGFEPVTPPCGSEPAERDLPPAPGEELTGDWGERRSSG